MRRFAGPLIAVLTLVFADPLLGQDRAALVDQARAEVVGSQPALDLLLAASNPTGAPFDSIWSVGVFDLADNLINRGEADLASVWMRWEARHGAAWPIDRTWYAPNVISAFDVAVPAVEADGGLGDGSATTRWQWPTVFDGGADGSILIEGGAPDLTVSVQGGDELAEGGVANLPVGTYTLTASAPGFETVTVSREVLPGVTTALTFNLAAEFTSDAEARARASLARIRYTSGGRQVCTNGVVVDASGLVLTRLSSVRGASGIQVATPTGAYADATLGPTDEDQDLVVLRAPESVGPAAERAGPVAGGSWTWSVFGQEYRDVEPVRAQVAAWPDSPSGPVGLSPALPAAAAGAPLVDASGSWLGVTMGSDTVLPAALTAQLVEDARSALVAGLESQDVGGGGGPPWLLIVGGVGAAGAAAALLAGGGGDDGGGGGGGGGGGNPNPSVGSIVITFPNIGAP